MCVLKVYMYVAVLTLPVGAGRPLWATPAAAGMTEAKTGPGWGVRGLWKFLEVSENCRAAPGSLLVHSWGPGVIESGTRGGREEGAAGPRSHAWPARLTLLHPAHTSFCLQYLQFLCFGLFVLLTQLAGSKRVQTFWLLVSNLHWSLSASIS